MHRLETIAVCVVLTLSRVALGFPTASDPPYQARLEALLEAMTLEEKLGQLSAFSSGWSTTGPALNENYREELKKGGVGVLFNAHTVAYNRSLQQTAVEETRLGIPLLFGFDVIHGYKTIYPTPLAESSSWDLELMQETARLAAKEATAAGINWAFSPMVDIARDPRWGRIAEGSGEDVYLGSLVAAARVRGYQGGDLADPFTLLACAKHYAGYGAAEGGRDYNTVDLSQRRLRDTYLPPFRAAVDAGVGCIMTAFNEVDGVPSTSNKLLLEQILRNEWEFRGIVVSDYTSINELVAHGVASDEAHAATLAIAAGVDVDLQGGVYNAHLGGLIDEGVVLPLQVDAAVRRVLAAKFELGLFDDPYLYLNEEREQAVVLSEELRSHALDSAKRSVVLLKNALLRGKRLLPLSKNLKSVAVIGPMADNRIDVLGTWHAAGGAAKNQVVSVLQGIREKLPEAEIHYARGTDFVGNDQHGFAEAVAAAERSEVVILALGESQGQSGEAASRSDIGLPGPQQQLLERIHGTGRPVVVLLAAGRPLAIEWMHRHIPAIVNTWQLGTTHGEAVASVLFGDHNPSGKLTVTFPRSVGQVPLYYNAKNTGRPFDQGNTYTTKYLDIANGPLYPFGYGLSYTSFEYSNLRLSSAEIRPDERLDVSVTVTNTGQVAGEDVVQLYLQDRVGSVTRPVKELKGFQKISLASGEARRVSFSIDADDLRFYDIDLNWIAEPGEFRVYLGGDSVSLLEQSFRLVVP
jgi:beta-glucosidase